MRGKVRPSELELQVLGVLWERPGLTVREVLGALPDGKKRAYTSVLSVMQVMEKKGLLSHTSQGNAHAYRAAVAREAVLPGLVGRMVSLVFGGRRAAAVQALLGEEKLSAEELAEIRRLLEEHEKKTRKGRKEER